MAEADENSTDGDAQRWAQLMHSAQGGCEEDYHQLLTELGGVIGAWLRKRFGGQHFVEDCVQESLIAIHQARHTYDPQRPFRPWMFAIVRHRTIDCLRRLRSRQDAAERHRQETLVHAGSAGDTPEDALSSGRLIDSLSPAYREAITLTKILGLSNAEAAAQLSISESAVKVRVHRAIVRLRRMLEVDSV